MMEFPDWLTLSDEVGSTLQQGGPVVALESTLISHGLPYPVNLETAIRSEQAVRESGSVPATIGVYRGRPTVGLTPQQLGEFAAERGISKAARRDIAAAVAFGNTAATTVSATMRLAQAAGISILATGGIGGVHRHANETFDISADLTELASSRVLGVCAGAKSILDLPKTLELLEALSVPVAGFGAERLPAFYVRETDLRLSLRFDSPGQVAKWFASHSRITNSGAILCQPVAEEFALDPLEFEIALAAAMAECHQQGITGAGVSPYLLSKVAEKTDGRSIRANCQLIEANSRLAGHIASEFALLQGKSG